MAEDAATIQEEPKAAPAEPKAKREPKAKGEPKAPAKPESLSKPVDPRLKVLKRFHGQFLPKGVLRERQKAIINRWNSGPDHGGVTVEELKALLADWLGTREKPPRKPKA
jgi:hypothetical protein